MQLKLDNLMAVKGAGLLPAFGYALLATLMIGLALGGYGGWKIKAGATALKENAQLRADTKAWSGIAEGLRLQHAEQTVELGAAIKRLSEISQGREDDREELRKWMATQSGALDALRRQRPDLEHVDLGPEFLRHWNAANTGAVHPAVPATGNPPQPAPTVPGASPAGHQPPVRDPGATRHGDGAVPRLQEQQGASGSGRGRMAGNGMALVLPGRHRIGREGKGLPA